MALSPAPAFRMEFSTENMTLDEREIYDALYQLYCAADDSLLAAYRALDAGYKIGKQYGRG